MHVQIPATIRAAEMMSAPHRHTRNGALLQSVTLHNHASRCSTLLYCASTAKLAPVSAQDCCKSVIPSVRCLRCSALVVPKVASTNFASELITLQYSTKWAKARGSLLRAGPGLTALQALPQW